METWLYMGSQVQGEIPRLFSGQRRGCLNQPWPITILMNILLISIDPSSGDGWWYRPRPTLEHWTELPKVQMRSRRTKKMKKEIRTARDPITHWYKGTDLMRVYQGQLDWEWTRTWSNQILGIWPDSLNVAGPKSFWKAIDNDTGTCFLCIYWILGIQSVWILTFLDLEGGVRNLNFPQGRKPWLP